MQFEIITIFPEMFREIFRFGIIRRAMDAEILKINVHDLRDYTHDRHRQVDDRPFGGGAGMVLKPEPVFRAIEAITASDGDHTTPVILLSPQGRLFTQEVARELAKNDKIVLICGRYEGVDERVTEFAVTDELSIGDYVLSGGEVPAMVVVEAVTRLLPGALGSEESAEQDSFSDGILDYAHYTRPADYRGLKVPDVLQNGNHGEIARWRRRSAVKKTIKRRPDLLNKSDVTQTELREIEELSKIEDSKS